MGCNQIKSEEPKQDCVFTEKQYLQYMLDYIQRKEQLCYVLDRNLFIDLKKLITDICWPQDDKAALARLLEDYIRFSIQETYSINKKHMKYDLENFGKQFGEDVAQLKLAVEQKNRDILKTLDFYKNFDKYYFPLSALTKEEQAQVHKIILQISTMTECCTEAYFYLSLILVRGCRDMERKGKSMFQINQKLQQVINFINNDFIDTPETEVDTHNLMIYHQLRQSQYEKHPSKVYDTKFQYKKVKLESSNKEEEFQNEIMELVEEAKKEFQYFQRLLHKIVQFYDGYKFKINFKLRYREDTEALQRIKQKILSKQNINFHKDTQLNYSSIDQLRKEERRLTKDQVKKILDQNPVITFNISDLLRARCTFSSIQNVNEAAEKIIKKIDIQKKRGWDIELLAIDNRFKSITNDLVLKIRLGKTVTQFQMSFTTQKLESFKYEIYHKVYQIGRSKMLSSISMLFTWHEKKTIEYIKFLSKVISHKSNQATPQQIELLKKLQDQDDVSEVIEQEIKNTSGDLIPLKNDIVTVLIADKTLDEKKVENVKLKTLERTADYYEKIGNIGLQKAYIDSILNRKELSPNKRTQLQKKITDINQMQSNSKHTNLKHYSSVNHRSNSSLLN